MLTVTVNDRPIEVPAIVERGRIFLPLRTVLSALGATVSYDARQRVIVARNASHTLTLPVASEPVRLIDSRAYVPLRYVAENLGAIVTYDAGAQLVRVRTSRVQITGLSPLPDAAISNAYPTISAVLASANAAPADVVLQLDGQDVTPLATFDGSTITFLPRQALARGRHTVTFSGRTLLNDAFSASWSFDTTITPPPEDTTPRFSPFDYRLYADRNAFYRGDWMHFTLVAPPGGTARLQLCNLGFDVPLQNGGYGDTYRADVPAPLGYWLPNCAVTAVYTSWNGTQTFVPVPFVIAIYTTPQPRPTPKPTPKPAPTPQPRRIEPMPRRPEPTPAATPARKASSTPRSLRRDRPSPRTTPGR
jgi:hypothetical protein